MHFVESWTNKHSQPLNCAIRQQWLNHRAWKTGILVNPIYNGCLFKGINMWSSARVFKIGHTSRCCHLVNIMWMYSKSPWSCLFRRKLVKGQNHQFGCWWPSTIAHRDNMWGSYIRDRHLYMFSVWWESQEGITTILMQRYDMNDFCIQSDAAWYTFSLYLYFCINTKGLFKKLIYWVMRRQIEYLNLLKKM